MLKPSESSWMFRIRFLTRSRGWCRPLTSACCCPASVPRGRSRLQTQGNHSAPLQPFISNFCFLSFIFSFHTETNADISLLDQSEKAVKLIISFKMTKKTYKTEKNILHDLYFENEYFGGTCEWKSSGKIESDLWKVMLNWTDALCLISSLKVKWGKKLKTS